MQTRVSDLRKVIFPIGFALACVVATIFVWHSFGGSIPFEAKGYEFTVRLPQANALYPGSDVRMAGVTVGKIVRTRLAGSDALVTVALDPEFAPMHAGATAIARTKTLLGEGYIEIAPGPASARVIPDGGALRARQVKPTQTLDDVLGTFTPGTRSQIRHFFTGLAAGLSGRAQSLNDSLGYAAPMFASFAEIAQTLQTEDGPLQQLIGNAGQVFQAVGERSGTLQAAVNAGDQLLGATARSNRALTATINALPAFVTELQDASGPIGAASGDLTTAVNALRPVVPQVAPALTQIDATVPNVTDTLQKLPAVLHAGDRGLPALTSLAHQAGTAFAQIYPAARQVIPFLQLLGLEGKTVVGLFANVPNAFGVGLGPGNLPIRILAGIPTIWNETLAGWVKRLPTNRLNPYPAPGSIADIATGGLKAYDCRNIHNPLYLPPTGTGAPPCLLQGPWTFNGKTAYFPHLTEAGP